MTSSGDPKRSIRSAILGSARRSCWRLSLLGGTCATLCRAGIGCFAMRLVSFEAGPGPRAALLRDGRVYDIWGEAFAHVRGEDRTVYALLQGGLLPEVEPVEEEGVPVDGVELLPPITRP